MSIVLKLRVVLSRKGMKTNFKFLTLYDRQKKMTTIRKIIINSPIHHQERRYYYLDDDYEVVYFN